jgi:hypothetical protein
VRSSSLADASMGISRGREQPQDVVATDDRPSAGASGISNHGSGRSSARALGRDAVGDHGQSRMGRLPHLLSLMRA